MTWGDDNAIGLVVATMRQLRIVIDNRHRNRRCGGVAIVRVNQRQHIVSGQHLKNGLLSRFTEGVGVSTDIDRPTNALRASVFDDGLGDCQDVLLVKRGIE